MWSALPLLIFIFLVIIVIFFPILFLNHPVSPPLPVLRHNTIFEESRKRLK
jgi:hypothetical protein